MKEWYKSKTIWIAVLQGVLGVLVVMTDMVPAEWMAIILLTKSFIDIVIRTLTTSAIGKHEPKTEAGGN